MAINLDHVTEQITVTDTATNASLTVQPKGTGAFNIAAGSSGLNLSNGGTVTALTLSGVGYGYTTQTSAAISAPTTAGGVQATATVTMGINTASVASGGTGYAVGNVLSVVGGTSLIGAATLTVTAVSGGVITAVSSTNFAAYSVLPSSPVSVTGGTGSGATFNPLWFTASFIITNAGSGYVEQPTVTFSGGGGSGAIAYATVGSGTAIRALGATGTQSLDFYTPASASNGVPVLRLRDTSGGDSYTMMYVSSNSASLLAQGNTNANLKLGSNGAGSVVLTTFGGGQTTQFQASHTVSAVNYVQVTGAATGSGPTISAQGSDTNVNLFVSPKGTGSLVVNTAGGYQFIVGNTPSSVNWLEAKGGATGSGPQVSAAGTDTNIDLNLTSKGTGSVVLGNTGSGTGFKVVNSGATNTNFVQVAGSSANPSLGASNGVLIFYGGAGQGIAFYSNAYTTAQFNIAHTASAVNFVQVTGAATGSAPIVSAQGSDANIPLRLASKGTQVVTFSTNYAGSGTGNGQFNISHTASTVNTINVTGSATGIPLVISATGSDTNIPLVLQPKGTGALQAQQTDSTVTGGNARGINAVDWQTVRGAANQVASGSYSVTSGGFGNKATAYSSSLVGGLANNSLGSYSFAGGGLENSASGSFSATGGGFRNNATGPYNFVGGGYANSGTSGSAVTTQSATMNGTTAVTLSASNAAIKVGQLIAGTYMTGYPNDTYVAAISGTSLTLSQAASGSGTATLSFFTPHGVVVGGGNNTATGSYSFIGGGGDAGNTAFRNTASGDWSVVCGGTRNTASGIASFVGGGGTSPPFGTFPNTASGTSSVVVGGFQNNASGSAAFVGSGYINLANSQYSAIMGGEGGISRGIVGNHVFPACVEPLGYAYGLAQSALLVLARQTTDATPARLTADSNTSGITTNQVILPNNAAYFFTGELVAGVTGGGDTKGWKIEGVIKRGANAAATALVGTPTVTSMYADVGAATWAIAVTADTTNGGLAVTFTGQASTTIRTVAQIRTTEMTY